MSPVARHAARAVTPLVLVLAVAGASRAGAQQPTAGAARAQVAAAPSAAVVRDAAEDAATLRLEPVVALPDTLSLTELTRGVPLLLQAVTRDGHPVRTPVSWRVVSGAGTRIAADAGTDAQGFASAMLGRVPLELARPGRVVIEARTAAVDGQPARTVRLSTVVVRGR